MVIQESQENYFIDTVLIVERFANTTNWTRCSLWINMEVICIHQHDFSSHECFFKQWWPCLNDENLIWMYVFHWSIIMCSLGAHHWLLTLKLLAKLKGTTWLFVVYAFIFLSSNTGLMKLMCTSNLIKIRLLWLCSRCSNAKLHVVQDISKSCSTSG